MIDNRSRLWVEIDSFLRDARVDSIFSNEPLRPKTIRLGYATATIHLFLFLLFSATSPPEPNGLWVMSKQMFAWDSFIFRSSTILCLYSLGSIAGTVYFLSKRSIPVHHHNYISWLLFSPVPVCVLMIYPLTVLLINLVLAITVCVLVLWMICLWAGSHR